MGACVILLRPVIGWCIAFGILLLRATCRIVRHADPRPALRATSRRYAYAVLHAHQVTAIVDGEPGTGAMVSRSIDGGMLLPSLWARGIVPIRGSSSVRGRDKGGVAAFHALVAHVEGGAPAYLAVDGPRGPRNQIQKGIALLSQQTGAAVLTIIPVPVRRWILRGTWDRLQIPQPFSTIHVYFGEPVYPCAGEDAEEYRVRIERALTALECEHDPQEAALVRCAGMTPHRPAAV
jgi:lysophospholipid acyltransferase (LPLAT)-like uncharacterized protein